MLLARSIVCEGHLRRHASTTTAAVATSATPTAATTHGRAPSGPLGGSGCDSCPDFHWKDLICGAKVRGTHGTSDSGMRAPERAALRLGTYGYHEAVRAPRTARPRHGVHVNTGLHRGKPRAEFDDAGMGRSRRLEVGHIAVQMVPKRCRGALLHSLPRWGASGTSCMSGMSESRRLVAMSRCRWKSCKLCLLRKRVMHRPGSVGCVQLEKRSLLAVDFLNQDLLQSQAINQGLDVASVKHHIHI